MQPATRFLERFKLFRINQFVALRAKHDLPEFARIEGSPWPLVGTPVVERFRDGRIVVIDGTHRIFSARARGELSIRAIVVDNPNYNLPSQPADDWSQITILEGKLPREKRYPRFDASLFRPLRQAMESLSRVPASGS